MGRIGKLSIAVVLGAAVLAVALWFAGYFTPELDPAFEENLAAAAPDEVKPLIEGEAERLGVTALSIAILDADAPAQTLHFGRAVKNGLMQAASLSKAVAAAVILVLAEREGVGLDDDIRPQITSLDIASLEGGDRPVTLRQLLSHTTGASQSGYPGYPRNSEIPSTADVIANPPRFFETTLAFDGEPGVFRYSGGGYTIAQLWAQDVSGKDFATLAGELILSPLGMEHSTFAQPIERAPEASSLIITGADAGFDVTQGVFSSLDDSWHNYPEQAAAGLWTTAPDYARFAAGVIDAARGEPSAISPLAARALLSPQGKPPWGGAYGLGVMLETDRPIEDEVDYKPVLTGFSHTGANAGYRTNFSARLATQDQAQRIIVVMGNTASAAPLTGAIIEGLMKR